MNRKIVNVPIVQAKSVVKLTFLTIDDGVGDEVKHTSAAHVNRNSEAVVAFNFQKST
jgi:hypothetical protein